MGHRWVAHSRVHRNRIRRSPYCSRLSQRFEPVPLTRHAKCLGRLYRWNSQPRSYRNWPSALDNNRKTSSIALLRMLASRQSMMALGSPFTDFLWTTLSCHRRHTIVKISKSCQNWFVRLMVFFFLGEATSTRVFASLLRSLKSPRDQLFPIEVCLQVLLSLGLKSSYCRSTKGF